VLILCRKGIVPFFKVVVMHFSPVTDYNFHTLNILSDFNKTTGHYGAGVAQAV
jgi:hypothetical protein